MIESGSEKAKVAPAPTGPVYGRLERTVVEREVLRDGNVRTREQGGMTAVAMKPGQGVKSSDGVCYRVGAQGELRREEAKREVGVSARQARKAARKSRRAMRLAWSGR